jgi:predicted TIM-barrel fold metal-dependent hydrolase
VPIDRIARAHPRLRVVIAHAALPDVDAALDLLERHPALLADLTSASEWGYAVPIARLEALHARLLFGSDCPSTTRTIAASADAIRRIGLGRAACDAILGGNAVRLAP